METARIELLSSASKSWRSLFALENTWPVLSSAVGSISRPSSITGEGETMRSKVSIIGLLVGGVVFGVALQASAQEKKEKSATPPTPVQIVALDECDPATFNAAIGPDFCKNVALGAATTFDELFKLAGQGTPDPGWDFEPDVLHIKKGTPLIVVDQGGEPHTFTEVEKFGGGFIEPLNAGEPTVPECAGGFKN